MIVGIDATNLRRGGGRTHLIELLRSANPSRQGVDRVIVWGGSETLAVVDDKEWLVKICPAALDKGLVRRTLWQRFELSHAARAQGCDILFVPGGSFSGNFAPMVTMSQNLLPFEWQELRRFGWTWLAFKLWLLRFIQARSFQWAEGVIFLTDYARMAVIRVTGELRGQITIVPHGLTSRFVKPTRDQRSITDCLTTSPYRILYVSIIDQYKHQWHVVEAVASLRQATGWPLVLDLVGPAYLPALQRLEACIKKFDPAGQWARYHGAVPYGELHEIYEKADLSVFASSCENLPIILIEAMAASLPIACSDRGPMPEVLVKAGVYFNPEQPSDIGRALRTLIESPQLRAELAQAAHQRAQQFSWPRCADETFGFLVNVARRHRKQ